MDSYTSSQARLDYYQSETFQEISKIQNDILEKFLDEIKVAATAGKSETVCYDPRIIVHVQGYPNLGITFNDNQKWLIDRLKGLGYGAWIHLGPTQYKNFNNEYVPVTNERKGNKFLGFKNSNNYWHVVGVKANWR